MDQRGSALWWVACGVAIAVAGWFALNGLPPEWLTPHGLVGENGSVGVLLGLVTAVGAAIAAVNATAALRLSEKTELATRYQRAVELVGASSDAAKVGGIQILAEVALEDTGRYQRSAIRTLRSVLSERNVLVVDQVWKRWKKRYPDTERFPASPEDWPRSGLVVASTLGAILRIPVSRRWLGLENEKGRLRVRDVYLSQARIYDGDFTLVLLESAVMGNTLFVGCKFDRARIVVRSFGYISFENCELRDTQIDVYDLEGEPLTRSQTFWKCNILEGVLLNGQEVEEEYALERPLKLETPDGS